VTHQLPVYADVVNLLGENINTTKNKQKKKAVSVVSKEVGLEVNAEETKYMFMSRYQATGQSHYTYKGS
jgi:hypothetical protein